MPVDRSKTSGKVIMMTIPKLIKKSTLLIYKMPTIMETNVKIGIRYSYAIIPNNFG